MREKIIKEFNELVSGWNWNGKEIKFSKGFKEYEDIYKEFKKYEWFNNLIERIEIKQHGFTLVILRRKGETK